MRVPFGAGPVAVMDKAPVDLRAETRSAAVDLPDCLGKKIGGDLLEEVARGTTFDRLFDVGVVVVGGEDDDLGIGAMAQDLPGGLESVENRHGHIDHDHVGSQRSGEFHRIVAVAGLGDDLEVFLHSQQGFQPIPDDEVVVGKKDGDGAHGDFFAGGELGSERSAGPDSLRGTSTHTVVPSRLLDPMRRELPTFPARSFMAGNPQGAATEFSPAAPRVESPQVVADRHPHAGFAGARSRDTRLAPA